MKTIDGPSRTIRLPRKIIRVIFMVLLSAMIIGCGIIYHNYATYKSITVIMKKNASVAYGSENYDIHDLIKKVEGKIVSIKDNIDTNQVGEQEVLVKVKKANVTKEVPLLIRIIDTKEPEIQLNSNELTFTFGEIIHLTDIIGSVKDDIDGDLPFSEEDKDCAYHFEFDDATLGDVGSHEVAVVAKDKSGNTAKATFTVKIIEPVVVVQPRANVVYGLAPNPSGGNVVSIAYSLLGAPYTYRGKGPWGFDCSGFVHYVYSQVGVNISSSSSAQLYEGVGVPYEEAQPGDILSWGYGSSPSHSALYVGNGQMIHAANYGTGVILSDVGSWSSGSGTHIISVRRIQ